jgi:hypothetical protein
MPWNTTLEGATTRHVAQTLVRDGEADDLARLVDRRLTQAGDKSHTEEEVLRSTKSSSIHVHATFLGPGALSVKLRGWHKSSPAGLRMGWPHGELTLANDEVIHLRNLLSQYLAVGAEPDVGEYVVIRVDQAPELMDPSERAKAALRIAQVLSRPEVAQQMSGGDLGDELLAALESTVRLRELRAAVQELQDHLSNGDDEERIYQGWCDRHPWAFGSAWLGRDQVRRIGVGDHVDGLLESSANGLRDVLELKRPSHSVLAWDSDHRNYYFSSDVSRALGQCHRYLDVLHQDVGIAGLRDHPQVVGYHPRALIVIGRSHEWADDQLRALHGLNGRLHGITVLTYDQLLRQGRRALDAVESSSS